MTLIDEHPAPRGTSPTFSPRASGQRDRGPFELRDLLHEAISSIQATYEARQRVTGTPTGFTDLDNLTAGLHAGELVVLAGRPATGKSALALNVAVNAARLGGGTVVVFSLEGLMRYLGQRLMASWARVDSQKFRSGNLDEAEVDRLLQAVKAMSGLPLRFETPAHLTVDDVAASCRKVMATEGAPPLSLVVVDYLQLMASAPGNTGVLDIGEAVRGLKALACELNVPVLLVSTVGHIPANRGNQRPRLSDLRRDSEAIELHADLVLFTYREELHYEDTEDRGLVEVIVAKHRHGATGTVKLRFLHRWSRCDNVVPYREANATPEQSGWGEIAY